MSRSTSLHTVARTSAVSSPFTSALRGSGACVFVAEFGPFCRLISVVAYIDGRTVGACCARGSVCGPLRCLVGRPRYAACGRLPLRALFLYNTGSIDFILGFHAVCVLPFHFLTFFAVAALVCAFCLGLFLSLFCNAAIMVWV